MRINHMTWQEASRSRGRDGQVLVLFAGGLVLLLAIGSVVLDTGLAFMTRRMEQNVADPAAIAAARFIRSSGGTYQDMKDAACLVAHMDGMFGGPNSTAACDVPANDSRGTILNVNYPPSGSAGTFAGRSGFVEVVLTQNQKSVLGGILGFSTIRVSSSAVAAFSAGDSNSNSILALDPTSCQALKTHGTGAVTIHTVVAGATGGYVQVNSTCSSGTPDTQCSNSAQGALDTAGGGVLSAPHTYVAGTCKSNSPLGGPLTEGSVQVGDPLSELAPPDPADYPAGRCGPGLPALTPASTGCTFNAAGTIHIDPGVYYGGWNISKKDAVLELGPGVYIIAGGGISLAANASITSVQGGTGAPAPVLIFNTDNPATHTGQSGIDFNANQTLKLAAIDNGPYKGIVVWNDGNGSNPTALIDLEGQSSLNISGTIYSPKGNVKMEGGSSGTGSAAVQVIAWQIDVGGNAALDMPYDPTKLYQFDEKGLVH